MIDFTLPTILYGGTFDPVHEGHLHVAHEVTAALPEVKQLIFIPAAHTPGKPVASASAAQRLAWLKLAVEPSGFKVWDVEFARGGESYTIDTLKSAAKMGARRENLYWLLGADAYYGFPQWKEPQQIRSFCRLLVVDRPGQSLAEQDSQDRFLSIPPHPASSSALRERLARGETAEDWLPKPVRSVLDKLLPGQNPYVRKIV
jgi:nicotinate-nucleotide adenylyltransferase